MPLYSTISTSSASISIIAGRLRPYPYTVWVGLCGALIFRLIGIAAVGSLAIVTVFDFFAEFCLGFLSAESSIQFNVNLINSVSDCVLSCLAFSARSGVWTGAHRPSDSTSALALISVSDATNVFVTCQLWAPSQF